MKISKRTREQAIHILDARASSPWFFMHDLRMNLGYSMRVYTLAHQAVVSVRMMTDVPRRFELDCAEAACLLREGWTPEERLVHL